MRFLVLNGPNLSLLGRREPQIYGSTTLGEIEQSCRQKAKELGVEVECRQSDDEAELLRFVNELGKNCQGIIINAAALSHTSIALLDALKASRCKIAEVHISNIFRREEFRRHSYVSLAADGVISGFGEKGYIMAMEALFEMTKDGSET